MPLAEGREASEKKEHTDKGQFLMRPYHWPGTPGVLAHSWPDKSIPPSGDSQMESCFYWEAWGMTGQVG